MEFTYDKKCIRKKLRIWGKKLSLSQDRTGFMTHSKLENRKIIIHVRQKVYLMTNIIHLITDKTHAT
jgi:hypothetical protein